MNVQHGSSDSSLPLIFGTVFNYRLIAEGCSGDNFLVEEPNATCRLTIFLTDTRTDTFDIRPTFYPRHASERIESFGIWRSGAGAFRWNLVGRFRSQRDRLTQREWSFFITLLIAIFFHRTIVIHFLVFFFSAEK